MRLGQTSIIFFISKVLGSAIGFLATIYFARVLGEEVLGFYALVLSIVMWLTIVGRIGFTGALTKRISEGAEKEEYATAGAITIIAIAIVVVFGIITFRGHINAYVGRQVALFTAAITLVSLSSHFVYALLKGYHLVHVYAIVWTSKIGIRSILQVGLVLVGFQLTGLLIGHVTAVAIFTLVGFAILRIKPARPRKEHFVSLFDFAKFSWLGNIRGKTFDQVDIIVLGFFIQPGLIGVYSVAWSLGKFLDIFSNAIGSTLFPEMSQTAAQNDPSSISNYVEDALSFAGLIIIPGFVGGALLADRIMRIYGDGFVVGKTVLPILIAALLVYTYTKQLVNTLNAINRPELAFRANAAIIISNIALNIILVWQFGWLGAAVATALSAVVGLLFAYLYLQSLVSFNVPIDEIARQGFAALGMGISVYVVRQFGVANWNWIEGYNAVFVMLLVGLGAVVYFLILFTVSPRFRTVIDQNLLVNLPAVRN